MRSTFWPNRILERQSSQNRKTGLKFSSKRENSALFIKIVQNAFFMSCGARFAQMAFLSIKVLNIVTLPQILFKTEKQCAFYENCTKRSFKVMCSTFWPNRIFERHSSQNRETGLKFSSKRENSALFMKIVQNALFMSCGARFGQIAFFSVKVLKIVKLASNSLQNGKTLRFLRKLYKTLFSCHAQHVLAKSQFRPSKFSKSSHWPEILLKWEKTALSIKIVQNALFSSCVARFGQIAFLSVNFSKSWYWHENLFKTGKQCAFHEQCKRRSF